METLTSVEIRADEEFPYLPQAPIVEAVIDIKAPIVEKFAEQAFREQLERQLVGYHYLDSLHDYPAKAKMIEGQPLSTNVVEVGWKGERFQSEDEKYVAQFGCEGFVLSRLQPYSNWQQLHDEAFRLWAIFKALAKPTEILGIGLRFINRIALLPGEVLFEDLIQPSPEPPVGFEVPFHSFFHKEILAVPGHPYAIGVVRTIQPPDVDANGNGFLILDIDVITKSAFPLDEKKLRDRLSEMRWLKNKVFFGSVTKKALERFK